MRTFEHPNIYNGWKCPICGTNEDKSVTLVGIFGTEDGHNIEAEQVHIDCIELTLYEYNSERANTRMIAMQFNKPIDVVAKESE